VFRIVRLALERDTRIVTLDDANTRRGALDDPDGFTAGLGERAFIDELQRAPETMPRMRHWRGAHGEEVDIVLEDRGGRVIAIGIQSGASVRRADLRGLRRFQTLAGERFVAGVVLCTARQTTSLGRRIWASPIEALWV
jgi:predicted AAA+ superfamily ATPase